MQGMREMQEMQEMQEMRTVREQAFRDGISGSSTNLPTLDPMRDARWWAVPENKGKTYN